MRLASVFAVLASLVVTSASLMACTSAGEDPALDDEAATADGEDEELRAAVFDESDRGTTVQVKLGRSFKIALESNASTGYQWKVVSVDRTLGQPKATTIAGDPSRPGSPGKQLFTWSTKSPLDLVGKHTITLWKVRSWQPNAPADTFTLVVDVVDPSATPTNTCGGLAGKACGASELCDYTARQKCGIADQMGTCEPRPRACIALYQPVCGCDFKTYSNSCKARAAGVAVRSAGACPADN